MIREKEKCNIENCLRFREKSAMILLYIWEWGIYILFALEIMEGGLDYGKRKCTIIVGLARQEHSAVFSVCQVLFHTIYNDENCKLFLQLFLKYFYTYTIHKNQSIEAYFLCF